MPLKPTRVRRRSSSFYLAMSYRIPLQVTKVLQLSSGTAYPICPRCHGSLDREYKRFCDQCGQRLGWDMVEFTDVISHEP